MQDARVNMHASYTFTGFADLGADEVMLYCYGLDPDQVDRLADVL